MALTDKLTNIADAIRSKTGSTDSLTLDAMPEAIDGIRGDKLSGFLSEYRNGSEQWFSSLTADDFAGVTLFRPYAFAGWLGDSIAFPDGVKFMVYGGYQFYECPNLENVTLPSDLDDISEYMFAETFALRQITLPSTITQIHQRAFHNSKIRAITIPAACKKIHNFAFYGCTSLSSVTFEGTPESIATNAFNGCTALKDIYVPWAEGEVADAPWATTSGFNATIHYNSQGGNT